MLVYSKVVNQFNLIIMKEKSLAGLGIIVTILVFATKYFNLDIDEGQITEGIQAIAQAVGFIMVIWGQVRRKDLKFGLIRK